MPSMLCYYENERHENFAKFTLDPENRVEVPCGYSSFFWDTEPSSKRAVERTLNLVFYRGSTNPLEILKYWLSNFNFQNPEHNDGGHFAALENPEDIAKDLRDLVSQEWK